MLEKQIIIDRIKMSKPCALRCIRLK